MNIETKQFNGKITEVKQIERNGVKIGIIAGYIATWDLDRGNEQFIKGAFAKSLKEHKGKNRQIRFKDHHGRTVGGYPIDQVKEDDTGLFGVAEVNLEVQQGRELHSLARQGVIVDKSIGFTALEEDTAEDGRRLIKEAIVWEGSGVDEPMNEKANIVEVKTAVSFQDLPLADRDRPWDASAAKKRVRAFVGADEGLTTATIQKAYSRCFLWYDKENPDVFASYKLPITDVIDGRLTAVPRGIFAAAARLNQTDIPESDVPKVISHLNRYYDKMDLPSPFREESCFRIDDFKCLTERELENSLRKGVFFSKTTAKVIMATLKAAGLRDADNGNRRDDELDWSDVVADLKQTKQLLEGNTNG